jgi:hypothetical protein
MTWRAIYAKGVDQSLINQQESIIIVFIKYQNQSMTADEKNGQYQHRSILKPQLLSHQWRFWALWVIWDDSDVDFGQISVLLREGDNLCCIDRFGFHFTVNQ